MGEEGGGCGEGCVEEGCVEEGGVEEGCVEEGCVEERVCGGGVRLTLSPIVRCRTQSDASTGS